MFGYCNAKDHIIHGANEVLSAANTEQLNKASSPPAPGTKQTASNTNEIIGYTPCLLVDKSGPIKVQLVNGSAVVEYTVTATNCAPLISFQNVTLDTCSLDDTVAGMPSVDFGTLVTGIPKPVKYNATITGNTTNIAKVTCDDQHDIKVSNSSSWDVKTYNSGLLVKKTVPAKLGVNDTVIYTVNVTNTGSSSVDNCRIVDVGLGVNDTTSCAALGPGGSCKVTYTGLACSEAPAKNTVTVTCEDQLDRPVTNSSTTDKPFCAAFDVEIKKDCDTKVVQVPGNPADPIDCSIQVENTGPGTLTNCKVSDTLSGLLKFNSTLATGVIENVTTSTTVTAEMITAMTVMNNATITCDTQENFDPVSDWHAVNIEVRSVDGTVKKICTPATQSEPGDIQWEWWANNTSSDGKSKLKVDCSGISTVDGANDPNDFFSGMINASSATHNTWNTSGLTDAVYENFIECTFTAQDDRSFKRNDTASCEVDTAEPSIGFFVGGGKVIVPNADNKVNQGKTNEPKGNAYAKATNKKLSEDEFILTHGFELHCDPKSGPNNLEVNWLGNQFHLEELEKVICTDDDSVNEPPRSTDTKTNGPGPTTDVYNGNGYGRYNGECAAFAEWVFDDNGEPGKADHIVAIRVTDAGGSVVLDWNSNLGLGVHDTSSAGTWKDPGNHPDAWLDLKVGNHQWVPHTSGQHGPVQTNPCPEVTDDGLSNLKN